MLKINFKPATKNLFLIIIKDVFLAFYFLLIIFFVMEIVKPRIVTSYISLDLLMFGLIILGIITIFYYQPKAKEVKKLNFLDYSTIILFSVLIGIFTAYLVRQIGILAGLVGLVSAIISYYFATLIYKE
ncbi:MAG: hypothetical protein NTX82_01705 [Candidatus Parcubacteria bacterium]|nr:hypothetical protein [Candidatus Parcubacteria bacterium]